ncbi:MAG: hypothetical protein AAGE98_01065 [Actinomycetota bacterium]
MFLICRSPKGGVGTSVIAAALALRHASSGHPTLLVDLCGDQPDLLGIDPPSSLGVGDWLAGGDDVPVDALTNLETEVAPELRLLARGEIAPDDRLDVLAAVLGAGRRTVVVDAGVGDRPTWAPADAVDLVVLRACYLAVRRAGRLRSDSRVVLLEEPGRALRTADVESAIGVDVWRRVVVDPAVARAVDAGLIGLRLPRSLRGLELGP